MTTRTPAHPADQLERLLAAHHVLVAELSPDAVLQRLVELARDVFGVEHAALVLLDPDQRPERVIDSGIDDQGREQLLRQASVGVARQGALPVLMSTPVRHGSTHFATLHLVGAGTLPAGDAQRELLESLAATAATAIENSLLHEQARRRADAQLAYGAISHELLAGRSGADVLQQVGRALFDLTAASGVLVLVPEAADAGRLEVVGHVAADGEDLRGQRIQVEDSIASRVMATGQSVIVGDVIDRMSRVTVSGDVDPQAVRHLMCLPLQGEAAATGAVMLYRTTGRPFDESDLEVATAFARQAALALERAEERAVRSRLSVLELRGRIADELNRQVVQAIFTTGLTLQGLASLASMEANRERLSETVENLDEAARIIRTTVFPQAAGVASGRRRVALTEPVLAVLGEVRDVLGFEPGLSLAGQLNSVADARLVSDVVAVVREALTNAAKHAAATEVTVGLRAEPEKLVVQVADNGVGLVPSQRQSGLANMRRRAEGRGGTLEVEEPPGGGLLLRWTVPLS